MIIKLKSKKPRKRTIKLGRLKKAVLKGKYHVPTNELAKALLLEL